MDSRNQQPELPWWERSGHRSLLYMGLMSLLALWHISSAKFVLRGVGALDDTRIMFAQNGATMDRSQEKNDNTLEVVLSNCSQTQLDDIYSQLFYNPKTMSAPPPLMESFYFWNVSGCYDDSFWLNPFLLEETSEAPFEVINVGCNKGLDAVAMMRLASHNPLYSVDPWHKALGQEIEGAACGGIPPDVDLGGASKLPLRHGTVHCIEPASKTVEALNQALAKTGYQDVHSEDRWIVGAHALSNYVGEVFFPIASTGAEQNSIGSCEDPTSSVPCERISVTTLDAYLKDHYHQHPQLSGQLPKIDMLLIDAEGYDHDVLLGAKETLQRVRYLTFEVHQKGAWLTESVVQTVENVLEEFACYWVGKEGQLWRISRCTDDRHITLYDLMKSWSNIVCVHRSEANLFSRMEDVFQQTISR